MNEEELQRIERGDPTPILELILLTALCVGVLVLISFVFYVVFID